MAVTLLTWYGKSVGITAKAAQMLSDLSISSTRRTKENDQDGIHKAEDDGLEPVQFTLTIGLDARLGVDVFNEVKNWMYHHRSNHQSKLLITGRDLFGVYFMLSDVSTANTRITSTGIWLHTDITLTFKEAVGGKSAASTSSGNGGGSSGKSSSSKGASSGTTSGSTNSGSSTSGDRNLKGAVGDYTPGAYSAAATNAIAAVSTAAKAAVPVANAIREAAIPTVSGAVSAGRNT